MNNFYFFIVVVGILLTWRIDSSLRKQAKAAGKWIAVGFLVLGMVSAFVKKFDIPVSMPSELFIQWIVPWIKYYITQG